MTCDTAETKIMDTYKKAPSGEPNAPDDKVDVIGKLMRKFDPLLVGPAPELEAEEKDDKEDDEIGDDLNRHFVEIIYMLVRLMCRKTMKTSTIPDSQ